MTRPAGPRPRVLVLGGNGFYGRYVVEDLLRTTLAAITIGTRTRRGGTSDPRVSEVAVDVADRDALRTSARGVDVVVHCAGPFTGQPVEPLAVAIDLRVPYVDISEDRGFARTVRSLDAKAKAAGVPILSGMSVSPAMEALAVRHLAPAFDSISAIRTYAAPDTKRHRGPAMFETMLYGAGKRFDQPTAGGTQRVFGWTEPEWFDFPAPVGRRLTYRIHDMADVDLLPAAFGLDFVAFKAGASGRGSTDSSASPRRYGVGPAIPIGRASRVRPECCPTLSVARVVTKAESPLRSPVSRMDASRRPHSRSPPDEMVGRSRACWLRWLRPMSLKAGTLRRALRTWPSGSNRAAGSTA